MSGTFLDIFTYFIISTAVKYIFMINMKQLRSIYLSHFMTRNTSSQNIWQI